MVQAGALAPGANVIVYPWPPDGFWNPRIYSAAQRPDSPFTELDQAGAGNDNLYYTGTPGARYNPAVGLGIPDLTALAGVLG